MFVGPTFHQPRAPGRRGSLVSLRGAELGTMPKGLTSGLDPRGGMYGYTSIVLSLLAGLPRLIGGPRATEDLNLKL